MIVLLFPPLQAIIFCPSKVKQNVCRGNHFGQMIAKNDSICSQIIFLTFRNNSAFNYVNYALFIYIPNHLVVHAYTKQTTWSLHFENKILKSNISIFVNFFYRIIQNFQFLCNGDSHLNVKGDFRFESFTRQFILPLVLEIYQK